MHEIFPFLVSFLVLLYSKHVCTPTKLITQFHTLINKMKTVHAYSFDHPIFLQCGDDVYATPVNSAQIYQECLEEVIVYVASKFGFSVGAS